MQQAEVPIMALLARVSRFYKTKLNAVLVEQGLDLSSEMYGMLLEIAAHEGCSSQDLAFVLYKDKGGVTKILKRLYQRGLIVVVANKEDRRVKNIFLNEEGKKVLRVAKPIVECLRNETLAGISEENLRLMHYSLATVLDNLSDKESE